MESKETPSKKEEKKDFSTAILDQKKAPFSNSINTKENG